MTVALRLPRSLPPVVVIRPTIDEHMLLALILPVTMRQAVDMRLPLGYVRVLYKLDKDMLAALMLARLRDQTRNEQQVRTLLNHVRRCLMQESDNLAVLLGYQHSNSGREPMTRHDVARALGAVILVEPGGKAIPQDRWEATLLREGAVAYASRATNPFCTYGDLLALVDFMAKWLAGDLVENTGLTPVVTRAARALHDLLTVIPATAAHV